MRTVRRFFTRFHGAISSFSSNQQSWDERIREETESHIFAQTDENIRAGMTPQEARRLARLKFGAVEAVRESTHAERSLPSWKPC